MIESDVEQLLIFDMHHIISDGVSLQILIEEFMKLYNREDLPKLKIQYKDFAVWQNEHFNSDKNNKQETYWLEEFNCDEIPVLNLPIDYPRPAVMSFEGDTFSFNIDEEVTEKLNQLSKEQGATMYMILMAAYNIFLAKYTGQDDIIVGTPKAGRSHVVLNNVFGMFVNTLVIRNYPEGAKTVLEFLNEVKDKALKAYENQDYQLEMLIEKLDLKRNLSRNPLFETMFALQNINPSKSVHTDLKFRPYEFESTVSKFDLSLTTVEMGSKIGFTLEYCTKLFKKETIKRMANHYVNVIKEMAENSEKRIADIEILLEEERYTLLNEFNNTNVAYQENKTIHQLFEERVKKIPDQTAVVLDGKKMTYRELNEKANQIANHLRSKGVIRDQIIALLLTSSFEMVSGIFGVLKAGGAYLPIDPDYPEERIQYILKDSSSEILLTETSLKDQIQFAGEVIDLKDSDLYFADYQEIHNINVPNDLAYILYTSGSTGQPKGVMIEHRSVINLSNWYGETYQLQKNKNVLQMTNYTFDPSVEQIFGVLLNGAILYLIRKEVKLNKELFRGYINENQINIVDMVPSALKELLLNEEKLDSVKVLISGGEKLEDLLKDELLSIGYDLYNHYGLTETTVEALVSKCSLNKKVVLGNPISNSKCYIVDKWNKPVPIGVIGEICISGVGTARGYLNNPDLTGEKFIPNMFVSGERMYRTGDLGRWLSDGTIEYYGRIDSQVKIRGYRIELGEIEDRLREHQLITEAVVIDREDQDQIKYLVAYIVTKEEVESSMLRTYLAETLPQYMIPAFFLQLEKMPLTSNGKINVKALPLVDGQLQSREYIAPRDEVEEQLSAIWSEILNVERIGITDNFFELGGHSLKATSMISKVFKEMNIELPLREIFKNPQIEELAQYIRQAECSIYDSIQKVEQREHYPLSSAQQRLYIVHQLEERGISYNMPVLYKIAGDLNKDKFENAIRKLVNRHEAFRTSFILVNGDVVQKIQKDVDFKIEVVKVDDQKEEITKIVRNLIKPFDLSKAPLFRVGLIEGEAESLMFFDMHHSISDGVSMEIMANDFMELYHGKELPELRLQYKDFSAWQNNLFKSDKFKKQEENWLTTFGGQLPFLNLPTDFPRPSVMNFIGDKLDFSIGEEETTKLRDLIKDNGVTLYMVLLAAFNILLSKYSGQEDIVIGSPIAGRPHADLEKIIGIFVNTLAMRNNPIGTLTFAEFLTNVKDGALNAYENQDYQFEMLVEKLGNQGQLNKDLSRNPLFDVMFTLQNSQMQSMQLQHAEAQQVTAFDNLRFVPYSFENKVAKFDLTLTAVEGKHNIGFSLNYSTQLFEKETIMRMATHFKGIVKEIVNSPMIELKDIQMITSEEKQQLLYDFAYADFVEAEVANKTVNQIFDEQVAKTPENIAVMYGEEHLTYRQLNEKANQLAKVLRKKGVKSDEIVAIMVERSFEMMIGILAILKAGGAYLPIDPNYPFDRIGYILNDSKASVLLTNDQFNTKIADSFTGEVFDLKDESLYSSECSNLGIVNKPQDLAYVLYTSGSTGKPKGVMVEHHSLVNTISHLQKKYSLDENDTILQSTVFTFDASVREIVWWFFNGAKCCLLEPDGEKFPLKIIDAIDQHQITVVKFVPILLNEFLTAAQETDGYESKLSSLKYVFVGGEALPGQMIDKFYQVFPANKKLVNLYGPTETTIHCTEYEISQFIGDKYAPIGKPISNDQIYVLDQYLNPVPVGVAGEIYISGVGVARGYLNNPEMTEERFMQSPFDGERMYKSGDIGRWLADGNLEFLNRVDHQVKIRGFRIELGEIENQLLKYNLIQEAVVIDFADENGGKYLCAYIVAEEEQPITEIKAHLQTELPEYMIPAYFVQLEKLPLTWNGKVDRKALPKPENSQRGSEYVAPRDRIEATIARIWSDILGVERVSITDNFFEIGGHSLKATSFIAKAFKELNIEIPLREVFKHPTIKELAEFINGAQKTIYSSIKKVDERDYAHGHYPLSSAQYRLYILNELDKNNTGYNMPGILQIQGTIDKKYLENVFNKLIKRHEAFRTSFEVFDGKAVQKIHDTVEFEIVDLTINSERPNRDSLINEFIKPFDLSKAPLFRVGLIESGTDEYILIFDMHHIISDGVSMNILKDEFMKLYLGQELPDLRIQYKDYSVWQNDLLNSEGMKKQEEYWLEKFGDSELPVLDMPTDCSSIFNMARPAIMTFEGASFNVTITKELTAKLNELAKHNGATLYMVLLASYNLLLSKYTHQEDIIVGSPIAGRPHADLDNIIGMFVNTLAMRNFPRGQLTFVEFLEQVKENALEAYENQDYQFEMLVDKLELRRDMSRNPIFDTMFVLQNLQSHNLDNSDGSKKGNQKTSRYGFEHKIAKFDLTLTAIEINQGIQFAMEYRTQLFKRETIERMAEQFVNILTQIIENPDQRLMEVEILSNKEKEQIMWGFNNTKQEYPSNKTIHQLFEEQVIKTPNQIASVYNDQKLTYKELNIKANQLARLLEEKSVKSDQIIGIMMERSLEMIIGMLAVLKAGAAYLPIDPAYPEARIEYMLTDSNTGLLLTQDKLSDELNFTGKLIAVDKLDLSGYKQTNLDIESKSTDLAYVIYTSGSTGKPKGVMIEHKGIANLKNSWKDDFAITQDDRIIQFASCAFDASVSEIYMALLLGATLYVISNDIINDYRKFESYLNENVITTVTLPPVYLNHLSLENILSLKRVITAGSATNYDLVNRWRGNVNYINAYG